MGRRLDDYPVGVLHELQKLGVSRAPLVLELSGNLPFGPDLSSSASVEVATCMALLRYSGAMMLLEGLLFFASARKIIAGHADHQRRLSDLLHAVEVLVNRHRKNCTVDDPLVQPL
jgi:hypothetical protein